MDFQEYINQQQAIVDLARSEGRDLTAEEQAKFNALQAKITAARSADPGATGNEGTPAEGTRGADGQAPTPPTADGTPADGAESNQRAIQEERRRMSDIAALCRETGMDPTPFIQNGETLDQARAAAVNHLLQHGAPVVLRGRDDSQNDFRRAASEAMLIRAGVPVENPTEEANNLQQLSLRDMAIECMVRDGLGTTASLLRMGKDDLFNTVCRQFFSPTASFPAILDNAIKKGIVHVYNLVPTTFQLWATEGSVSDFKPTKDHSYIMGSAGQLLRVGESGELKHDIIDTELLPSRQIDTYGRQFSMSRQAFINDDIGFITELPGAYAASAKRTINEQVYAILVKNPAIFDGAPLFDAAHNNLATQGSKPSNEAIQSMILGMSLQKDQFGRAIMVTPSYIIVPVGYAFLMSTILQSPTLNTADNTQAVNPLFQYKDRLTIVEDPTINALAGAGPAPWFMASNGMGGAKSIQVDYLNGQKVPTIRRSEVPGQLGFVWDIWMDWGISAVDYRGIRRNDGVIM